MSRRADGAAGDGDKTPERPSEAMSDKADPVDDVERISAWQCIGCGRIEGPQPCVGVCQDKKVTFVSAEAYDAAMARMRLAEARLAALESLKEHAKVDQTDNFGVCS